MCFASWYGGSVALFNFVQHEGYFALSQGVFCPIPIIDLFTMSPNNASSFGCGFVASLSLLAPLLLISDESDRHDA